MTETDFKAKIQEIENDISDTPESRTARAAYLTKIHEENKAREKEAAQQRIQEAESRQKKELEVAFFEVNENATPEDFEKEYPALRSALLQKRTIDALDSQKAQFGISRDF